MNISLNLFSRITMMLTNYNDDGLIAVVDKFSGHQEFVSSFHAVLVTSYPIFILNIKPIVEISNNDESI